MKEKHQKHTNLKRPDLGYFGRNEFSIIGTPCDNIKDLAMHILDRFSDQYEMAYMEEDHHASEAQIKNVSLYTDRINYQNLEFHRKPNEYENRVLYNDRDIIIVNGNHHLGSSQIVVIDEKKKESLSRKLDRLTDVKMVLFQDGHDQIWDFLLDNIEGINDVPKFQLSDTDGICIFLEKTFADLKPELKSLILIGGKSTRMGQDKASIEYHGQSQKDHLHELCRKHMSEVYFSVRNDHKALQGNVITDSFQGLGPFGAILSAFREQPETAWLTIACDLPFVNEEAISHLISKRDPSKMATAFLNPATGFADPLFTIWEPKSYMALLQFLAQGYSCPRKVLINSEVELIELPEGVEWLKNLNTPEQRDEFIQSQSQ